MPAERDAVRHARGDVVGIGQFQHLADFFFGRTVEHRRGKRHTLLQVVGQFQHFLVGQAVDMRALPVVLYTFSR